LLAKKEYDTFNVKALFHRTGSASDWCTLQEALYKCIDTIQYNKSLNKPIFSKDLVPSHFD